MESSQLTISIIIAYIIITTLIGSWSVKYTKDNETFMSAKNLMGPFVVGILLMSEFIATGSTLGTAETAFKKGISASWNVISLGIAYILFGLYMAPKFQQTNQHTISGALAQKYGSSTRKVVSLIMLYALVVITVASTTGGGVIISTLLGISIEKGVWIIGIATMLNVTLGGIRGVGVANLIHMFFKFISLIIIAFFGWHMVKSHPEATARIAGNDLFSLTGVGIPTLISWTFANIGAIFATQYVIQCISSLNSQQEARKASFIASTFIIPAGVISALIGIFARGLFPNINPVQAFPVFLTVMPPWLAGVAVMGIIAVTLVTILACQVGITALVMADFVIPVLKPSEQSKLRITRVVCMIVSLLPIPFALFVPGLLKTIFFARALRTTIAVVAVFMFYLPHVGSGRSAALGLLLSVAGTSLWFMMGDPLGIDNVYMAMLIPAIVMFGEKFITKEKGLTKQKKLIENAGN